MRHASTRPAARRLVAGAALVLAALGLTTPAHAYSTRVHIVMANRIREALIASGDDTIALEWSGYSVTLSHEDAQAIIDNPLAFRAGAIGPDNTVFPALTDGTHALTQNPYRQCELLYEDALVPVERAYALGCFLHGATDAIAHHFVNDFTGETFTLTPLSASRASAFDNVVGHITTEEMIQAAYFNADPTWFTIGELQHTIPLSFVQRNYWSIDAPLWQLMAAEAVERLEAARAASPGAPLYDVVGSAELETYHYLALAPLFVSEVEMERVALRQAILDEIANLQDHTSADGSVLLVTPGPDGVLSTEDDQTACTTGCSSLFARYYVLVRLMQPRMSAGGTVLPSAYDVVMDELGMDLQAFIPALLLSVENLSLALNGPLSGVGGGFELDATTVSTSIAPMRAWADDVAAIDFETVTRNVAPDWAISVQDFLNSIGISINFAAILESLVRPITDEIRRVVIDFVVDQAELYIDDLRAAYAAQLAPWQASEAATLAAGSPTDLGGDTTLDHLRESGLFAYSFNFTAAVLADHRVILVDTDTLGSGPTSFDASYTPAWSQAGLCDYLADAIFPIGFSMPALFAVRTSDGVTHTSPSTEDSPVECHDGALDAFGTPSVSTCAVTSLGALLADTAHQGSLSRAYPPDFASGTPTCMNLTIAGLPPPPETPDAGPSTPDGGTGPGGPSDGGCACSVVGARVPAGRSAPWGLGVIGLFALALLRRRRRQHLGVLAAAALVLGLTACDPSEPVMTDAGAMGDSGGMEDAPVLTDVPPGTDAPDLRRALLDALGTSVWSALQTRTETSGAGSFDVERAYEIRFDASSLQWAEIRNPFGPARRRRLRVFSIMSDGATVMSRVMTPPTWPIDPIDGRSETWTFEIVDGSPRELHITDSLGVTEIFVEGAWAAPTTGLTAEVRSFAGDGAMQAAACGTGLAGIGDAERGVILGFARGESSEVPLNYDVVAGAPVSVFSETASFAVPDVTGFDPATLGGTLMSEQVNFVVRYVGTVAHAGGALRVREDDDVVEGGLVVFAGTTVGSSLISDILLEVQDSWSPDATADTTSLSVAAGDVPIEVIIWRCATTDRTALEIDPGTGVFRSLGTDISAPDLDTAFFPPAL